MKIRFSVCPCRVGDGLSLADICSTNEQSIGSTENKKEIKFSGIHYWSGTPKVFPIDPDRIILEMEIYGVRVNDSNDGPLNGASVYIAVLHYENRGHNKTGNPLDQQLHPEIMRSGQIRTGIK